MIDAPLRVYSCLPDLRLARYGKMGRPLMGANSEVF